MRRAVRSNHFWIAFGLLGLFILIAKFTPHKHLILATNSFMLWTATATSVAFLPVAWRVMRDEEATRYQRLALGVAYISVANALWRMLTFLWLTSGQDPVIVNNDIVAGLQFGISIGYCYHLASPGAIGGPRLEQKMPRLKWIVIGLLLGGALALSAIISAYNPNTGPFVEIIKPYIPR